MVADQGVRLGRQQQYHAVQQHRLARPGALAIGDGSWKLEVGAGRARHSVRAVVVNQKVLFGNGGRLPKPAGRGLPALPVIVPSLSLTAMAWKT